MLELINVKTLVTKQSAKLGMKPMKVDQLTTQSYRTDIHNDPLTYVVLGFIHPIIIITLLLVSMCCV